jgi:hypothetical protein
MDRSGDAHQSGIARDIEQRSSSTPDEQGCVLARIDLLRRKRSIGLFRGRHRT